ncbi:MAG: lysophospholipid acyltransferase family protein [Prevotella sp.]
MAKNMSATAPMLWYEKILFGILYSMVWAVSLLPLRVLYVLSDGLYLVVCKMVGYRRRVVRKNLRLSFPEKSEAERREIERGFYHFFCDYIFETIKLATMSEAEMRRRLTFSGLERIDAAIRCGHGVSLFLGHYCNWEWVTGIGLYMPEETFRGQVYHVLESKVMDRLLLRVRSRMRTTNVPMAEIMRRLVKERQEGRLAVIGFISDQSPIVYNIPYWTTFMNQPTPFINGTERLTKKLGMSAVYLDISRVRRGYYHIDVVMMAKETKTVPDWQLTQQYAELLEKSIRRQPPYWLWSHNRWKRKPADFYNAAAKA